MNAGKPLSALTETAAGAVAHPRQTVEKVVAVAITGAQVATDVVGWAARKSGLVGDSEASAQGAPSDPARSDLATSDDAPSDPATDFPEPAEDEIITPAGIPAAGPGVNPDTGETDLHQPDTAPLMDPSTVKAVKAETDVMRKGAERDKG